MTGSSRPKSVTYKCVIIVASRASVITGCVFPLAKVASNASVTTGCNFASSVSRYRFTLLLLVGVSPIPKFRESFPELWLGNLRFPSLIKSHFSHFSPNLFLSFFINNVFSVLARSSFFESSPGFSDPVSVWNADFVFNVRLLQSEFYKIWGPHPVYPKGRISDKKIRISTLMEIPID